MPHPHRPGVATEYERRFLPVGDAGTGAVFACDEHGAAVLPEEAEPMARLVRLAAAEGAYTDSGPVPVLRRVLIQRGA